MFFVLPKLNSFCWLLSANIGSYHISSDLLWVSIHLPSNYEQLLNCPPRFGLLFSTLGFSGSFNASHLSFVTISLLMSSAN